MSKPEGLYQAIVEGNATAAFALTREALDGGVDPLDLVGKQMIPAMSEVGQRFECEDYFVPELLLSARAMKSAMELIRPLLAARGAEPVGRVVIGTVKGDLHDIGKNLVASLLEGGGFEVIDLGADVSAERFIEAARTHKADLVALSALLTVTMPSMRNTIQALRASDLKDTVKVMVGGAPVTQKFATEIGADGYSDNASTAVTLARNLVAMARA
jgi:corrinoid protein of di/trimethylamine methyltransferase